MWNFSTYLWRDSTLFHIPPIVARFVNCCNSVVFRFLSAWHASWTQQPEKKDASAATEAAAPATESPATDEQEKSESGDADKTDSTAGESAKEENKVESTSTSEGNSSSASEASDSAK